MLKKGVREGLILCAGKGERLLPLTFYIHKTLIPFKGKPLIFWIIEKMKETGIRRIYVNLFYHADMVAEFLNSIKKPEIIIRREKELMGTGGGIANFKDLIEGDFLLHNSDIFHNFDLKEIIDFHLNEKSFFTMGLKLKKTSSKIVLKDKIVLDIEKISPHLSLSYTGISVVSKEFLNYLPEGKSDLIHVLKNLIREKKVKGFVFKKGNFIDIGTWEGILKAYINLTF